MEPHLNRILQSAIAALAFLTLTGTPAPAGDAATSPSTMEEAVPPLARPPATPLPQAHHRGFQSATTPHHAPHSRA
jgi:hypothetical protein